MNAERSFELIVFDMDGVLVDSSPCHAEAYDRLWRRIGVSGPDYSEIAGQRTHDVVAHHTRHLAPEPSQLAEWVSLKQGAARQLMMDRSIAFDDAVPVVRRLHESGARLALGTSASRASTRVILKLLGLAPVFWRVVTADDVDRGKPDRSIYARILDDADHEAAAALIVEDSAAGISAGLASGAQVISVRTGLRSEDPRFLGAFADLREVARMLGVTVT